MKKEQHIIHKLNRMSDDVADSAEALKDFPHDGPDSPSELLQKAAMLIDDAADLVRQRTYLAVGEVVQAAAHQQGVTGPVEFKVLGSAI